MPTHCYRCGAGPLAAAVVCDACAPDVLANITTHGNPAGTIPAARHSWSEDEPHAGTD